MLAKVKFPVETTCRVWELAVRIPLIRKMELVALIVVVPA